MHTKHSGERPPYPGFTSSHFYPSPLSAHQRSIFFFRGLQATLHIITTVFSSALGKPSVTCVPFVPAVMKSTDGLMFIQMCLKTWLVSALVTWRLTLRKPEHISFMDRNTCVTLWLLCYWKNKNGKNFSPRLKVFFFQLFGCWQRNQCCPFGAKVPLIPVKICWMWTRLWDRDVVFVFMSVLLCLSRLLSLSTWTLHWPKCQTRDKQKKKVGVFFLLTKPPPLIHDPLRKLQ